MKTVQTQARFLSVKRSGEFLIIAAMMLTTIGLVMVYAASAMKGLQQFGDAFMFIRKQGLVALAGVGAIFMIQKLSEKQIRLLTAPLLLFSVTVLALILVPGVYKSGGGANRWIHVFGVGFQPAELAKLALVFFLAKNLSREQFAIDDFRRGILPNLLVYAAFACFMMLQPDFGSTVLIGAVLVSMLFVAGLQIRYILGLAFSALALVAAAIMVAPYRMARVTSFLDPWSESRGSGFQIIQSYLAFQNGGFAGVGLGESKQKLYFLPEAHTDFILAVLGEEFGFIGVMLVSSLFCLFIYCGLRIAFFQTTLFRRYLAFGLTAVIGYQAAFNMAVSMGLLPTKGLPLPFISSGASSLLVSLIVSGFLFRLSKDSSIEPHTRQTS
jgi:cell division protein FtsW